MEPFEYVGIYVINNARRTIVWIGTKDSIFFGNRASTTVEYFNA